jgi:hypothetical protein
MAAQVWHGENLRSHGFTFTQTVGSARFPCLHVHYGVLSIHRGFSVQDERPRQSAVSRFRILCTALVGLLSAQAVSRLEW